MVHMYILSSHDACTYTLGAWDAVQGYMLGFSYLHAGLVL